MNLRNKDKNCCYTDPLFLSFQTNKSYIIYKSHLAAKTVVCRYKKSLYNDIYLVSTPMLMIKPSISTEC